MSDIVFSAKMLEAMHFLYLHLLENNIKVSVPKINTDGDKIATLDQLATEMRVDNKVAAYYAMESKGIKQEIVNEAQEVLHPGIYISADDAFLPVKNYAYRTAKNFDKTELKTVRMVRTIPGSRRFGQPRGSIIVRDGSQPLDGLMALVNDVPGYDKLADRKGRVFYLGQENGAWVVRNPLDNSVLHKSDSQESSLEWLNKAVGGSGSSDDKPGGDEKAPRTRSTGASGTRPSGDEQRDEVMNDLSDDKNSYNIDKGQKASLYDLTTQQLVVYKNARDRGANHEQALKLALASGPKKQS